MLFKLLNRAIIFDFFYNIITSFHNFYMKCNTIFYSRYCPCLILDSLDQMSLMVTTLQRQTTKRSDASPFFCSQFYSCSCLLQSFIKFLQKFHKNFYSLCNSKEKSVHHSTKKGIWKSTSVHQHPSTTNI